MGQKMVHFGQLGAARSRQDESIEVGEVGSKRPSSGGNGGHFAWCGGLICALLGAPRRPAPSFSAPTVRQAPDGQAVAVVVLSLGPGRRPRGTSRSLLFSLFFPRCDGD
jgi:hypothetical protein